MKKTIYMMRHGTTLFNVQHKIQGWCDAPLTQEGIDQAKLTGKYFRDHGIVFDHAYCSTSERASDTLELVTDMPYTRLKGLKEWNFGEFEGKDECLNPPLPYKDFFVQFGGESQQQLIDRMNTTLKEVVDMNNEVILIVSHGAAITNFFHYWEEYGDVHRKPGRFPGGSFYKFEYENGIFTPVQIYYNAPSR